MKIRNNKTTIMSCLLSTNMNKPSNNINNSKSSHKNPFNNEYKLSNALTSISSTRLKRTYLASKISNNRNQDKIYKI